jgi:hypothetical protein
VIIRKSSIGIISKNILTIVGVFLFIFNILFYPLMLPKIISSANSQWLDTSVYIFYCIYVASITIIVIGISRTVRELAHNYYNVFDNKHKLKLSRFNRFFFRSLSRSDSPEDLNRDSKGNSVSICGIIFDIIHSKRSITFFLTSFFAYGFFYVIVSSTLIIRPEGGISHMYGIEKFPYVIMMQYGPLGYTPAISIYLNDVLGIFIVPITLTIIITISGLVGFNVVTSVYAFNMYRLLNKTKSIQKKDRAKFISALGTVTGLFAACPSCASLYLFNAFAGSLSTTVASFAVSYYALFLLISIPLLVITPLIIASNIKKMNVGTGDQCVLSNKRK